MNTQKYLTSIQLVQQYYAKVDQMIRYGGTRNDSTLRKPVRDLLIRVYRVSVETMRIVKEMDGKRKFNLLFCNFW